MGSRTAGRWQALYESVKQQRVALACAMTVAVVFVILFHAPAVPVAVGCGGALATLLVRAYLRRP